MAYLREIKRPCSVSLCGREAAVEMLDRWNGSLGFYCRQCGKRLLKRQQQVEQNHDAREEGASGS